MFIIPFGIPHLPPDSLGEQETAGATEPDELDHYPVPTSPQPGREQCVDEQEYDYIEQPVMTVNMHKLFVWFLYWIQADIASLLLNLTHAMRTKLSFSHSNYALQKNQNVHVTYVIQQHKLLSIVSIHVAVFTL